MPRRLRAILDTSIYPALMTIGGARARTDWGWQRFLQSNGEFRQFMDQMSTYIIKHMEEFRNH
jgi:hypothetical protein